MYFSIQETGAGLSVLLSAGWIGRIVGGLLGTLAGGVIAVYPYLIIRRIFLKIGFPSRAELIGFILYTMIIIVAIRQIPR
jgi:hypothetical protein